MNKKIFALVLCLCLVVSLAACGSDDVISTEHMAVVEDALGAMFNIDVMPAHVESDDGAEVIDNMNAYWDGLAEAEMRVFGSDGQLTSVIGDEYMAWTKDVDRCAMKLQSVEVTDKATDDLFDYDEDAVEYSFKATVAVDNAEGEDESHVIEGKIKFLPTGTVRTLSLTQESLEKLR